MLSTAGDVIAQQLTCRREQRKLPAVLRGKLTRSKWDLKRTMMFAAFGGFYTGAVQHVWFGLLNSPAVAQLLPAFGTSGVSQALALHPKPGALSKPPNPSLYAPATDP